MVNLVATIVLVLAGLPDASGPAAPESDKVVRSALTKGGYPWYDAKTDSVVPVWIPGSSFLEWLDRLWLPKGNWAAFGEYFAIGLVILALAILLVVLAEFWRRYQPVVAETPASSPVGRIKGLPAGVSPGLGDPWEEALRCRERGDYSGAIVCLFAHQLIALDRLRVLRLTPGRTGRQLVRAIDDRRFRGPVELTLGLFETVYYGHRAPSAEAFEAVWSQAQEFERHVAEGAGA